MATAGGTTTTKLITNVGQYSLWEISNSSWDSTETFAIPVTGEYAVPVAAESKVIVIGALNETTEAQLSGTALSVDYDETTYTFTATESGATDDVITIMFYVLN